MIPTETMKKLRAFHNDPAVKEKYLARVRAHGDADRIEKGHYWEDGKGCAVGCTIEGRDHQLYETELGIPEAIACLEDSLFEMMPNEDAMTFPLRFLEAIPVGASLSLVPSKFIVFVLNDVLQYIGDDEAVKKAVTDVAALWERVINGDVPSEKDWSAAESAAESAAAKKYADHLIELLKTA